MTISEFMSREHRVLYTADFIPTLPMGTGAFYLFHDRFGIVVCHSFYISLN
jgi:hypothetical protein